MPHLLLQTSLSGRNYGDEPVASPQPPQAVVQIQGGNAVKLCSTEMSMRVLQTQPGAGMPWSSREAKWVQPTAVSSVRQQ